MSDPSAAKTSHDSPTFRSVLAKALTRRRSLIEPGKNRALRAFSGGADGVEGVYVDIYGAGAVLVVYEGQSPRWFNPDEQAAVVLEVFHPIGVRAIYVKPFGKDRSKLGGELPEILSEPTPAAGEVLPEAILIEELDWKLEVRLYDGLSTGLFFDQRENRGFVARWVKGRIAGAGGALGAAPAVLNTFAYTCAFSVAAAKSGAITTSVDVSARYLEWGKRNFAHNAIDPALHRFAKMDTFEFFGYAKRKRLKYDMIILDPPSFSTGSKKKGIPAWSSTADFAPLIAEAAALLNPKGVILASTNTRELCRPGKLEREIVKGLGREPRYMRLPAAPVDVAGEKERFAACAFGV